MHNFSQIICSHSESLFYLQMPLPHGRLEDISSLQFVLLEAWLQISSLHQELQHHSHGLLPRTSKGYSNVIIDCVAG